MKNRKIQENFHTKLPIWDFLSLYFGFQSRSSRLHVKQFWVTTDQSMVLDFSAKIWTKMLWIARKNRPPRAAGYTVDPRKHVGALFKEIRVRKFWPKLLNVSSIDYNIILYNTDLCVPCDCFGGRLGSSEICWPLSQINLKFLSSNQI